MRLRPLTFRSAFLATLTGLAALAASGRAQPASPPIASTGPELLHAVAQSPTLAAAARRTQAARERIASSGRLPDVEVEGMASRMVGPMDERAKMYELNVRQPLPKRGERAADRDRALAVVAMSEAEFAAMAGELAADTAMALAEADGAEARIRLLETQLARLDAVLRTLETRLATGTGRLAERLTVQSRLAGMQLMIEEERREAADALAEVRGRLGLAPDAPLPRYSAPAHADIKPDDSALVRLAAARGDEAGAMARMARASGHPMTSVGLRLERERTAMGDENTVGIAFMSELPFRGRRYARAEIRAAEAERAAAQTDATAARYRIASALTRVDRAEKLAASARRVSAETLRRLDAEYDSLTRTSAVGGTAGQSTILETVELLEKSTDTESQVIRADTAVRVARAELWRYAPVTQLSSLDTPLRR